MYDIHNWFQKAVKWDGLSKQQKSILKQKVLEILNNFVLI